MAMSITVDATYLTQPAESESLADGDDAIRNTRKSWQERAEVEHLGKITDTQGNHGTHRAGSAKCYYQAAAPTLRPDGVTALTDDDKGRLWLDTDTDILYIYKGTVAGWVTMTTFNKTITLQGTLYAATGIVPPVIFPTAVTITKVFSKLGTAPTGANDVRFDLLKNGTDSIFTTGYVELGDTNVDTETDLTAHATLAAGDYLQIDIEQIGSTVGGSDLSITIYGGLA